MVCIHNAKVVLETGILWDGVILLDGDRIAAVGNRREVEIPADCQMIDAEGAYVGPGFVDIHTHTGDCYRLWQDPIPGCKYHLEHGTTTVLPASYPRMTKEEYIQMAANIKAAMEVLRGSSIHVVHPAGNMGDAQ